jgi:hypothetical protein
MVRCIVPALGDDFAEGPARVTRRPQANTELPPGAEALDLGQAVLACLVIEGAATVRAYPVTPSAFFTESQSAIYRAAASLADRGMPVDVLTVTDTLRSAGQLDAVGGAAALSAMVENPLAACVPSSLPEYIRRLEQYGARRDALARSIDLTAHLQNGHTPGELLAEAEALAAGLRGVETPEPAPIVTVEGDSLRVAWPALDVLMTLDRARDTSEGPHADVRISRRGQRLHLARVSLLSSHQRDGLAKALERKAPALPWRDMLESAADLVVTELRRGAPIVEVIPRPRDPARVLLRVPGGDFFVAGEPFFGYADVGTGKGYVASAVSMALMTGECIGPFARSAAGSASAIWIGRLPSRKSRAGNMPSAAATTSPCRPDCSSTARWAGRSQRTAPPSARWWRSTSSTC